MLNRWVLSRDRKTSTEGAEVTRLGRLFQTRAASSSDRKSSVTDGRQSGTADNQSRRWTVTKALTSLDICHLTKLVGKVCRCRPVKTLVCKDCILECNLLWSLQSVQLTQERSDVMSTHRNASTSDVCYPSDKLSTQEPILPATSCQQVSTRVGEMPLRQQVEVAWPWCLGVPLSVIGPAHC